MHQSFAFLRGLPRGTPVFAGPWCLAAWPTTPAGIVLERGLLMHDIRTTWRRVRHRTTAVLALSFVTATSAPAVAQWFNQPSPRAPRTASGEVDLSAPTPRLANGRPDLSGVWMSAEPLCVIRGTAPI